jgi:hypothetical protein
MQIAETSSGAATLSPQFRPEGASVSDVIADLRRQMQDRLKEIERELGGLERLVREREQIQAALAQPPFAAAPASAEGCVQGVVERLGAEALPDDVAVVALRFVGV